MTRTLSAPSTSASSSSAPPLTPTAGPPPSPPASSSSDDDVNPSEDDNSDGNADNHDQQVKDNDNDEDNAYEAEIDLVFVCHSTSNTWVKQNFEDGSFDDLEYERIWTTVHNVYQYVFIKLADFTTRMIFYSFNKLC